MPKTTGTAAPKPANLALQGGGAHGAFTWGVLDYLLEHNLLKIEAISGTSAGAMNAVVLAQGFHLGGPDGRAKLWRHSGNRWRIWAAGARFSAPCWMFLWGIGVWNIPRAMSWPI